MPACIPPQESAGVEVGPEYELPDLSSLCHCGKGMASLMPDRADGLVDRIQQKPEKILSLHLVVLEDPTYIIVLPDKTVLCFWQFVNANW